VAVTKRSRTERREREREAVKLAKARLKLAALELGGAPDRPIDVESASTIEVHAQSAPCASCGERGVRIEEHTAETIGERRLRVVKVKCPRCGVRRDVYYRIGTPLLS
jgi:hypothetical protein